MEFITTEQMEKFNSLGYKFRQEFTPNNLGNTCNVIVTDKDGNEIIRAKSSYANATGRGYAISYAQSDAVQQLEAIINGEVEEKQEIAWDFLNTLANWDYIREYGLDSNDELMVIFETWEQLEGSDNQPSVFAKLVKLAEEGKLKPIINYTLTHLSTGFDDEYSRCDGCGKIVSKEWDGINFIENTCELLCNDCVNESESAVECLVEQAKENFSKALPVMVSEDVLSRLGYERVREDCFEDSWNYVEVAPSFMEALCKKYDGFAKLTSVAQWGCCYTALFPTDTVNKARKELFAEIGK